MRQPQEREQKEREQHRRWANYTRILYCAAGVCFFLMLITRVMGKEIYRAPVSGAEAHQGTTLAKAVRFRKPGVLHKIKVGGDIKNLSSCDFELALLDQNKDYLFSFEDSFWDEEGRDSEGYWHESDTKSSFLFVPGRAGDHYFHLQASGANTRTFEISVIEGVILLRYFLISTIVFLVAAYFAGLRCGWSQEFSKKLQTMSSDG